MASKFVPVTGLEQAVALREAGLLYFRNHRGGYDALPEGRFPHISKVLGEDWIQTHYFIQLEA